MIHYSNLNGNSGVYAYELGNDNIIVQFNSGAKYLYNYFIPGNFDVEYMKRLAVNGSGLNTYINTNVKKRYAAKLR